MENLNSEHKSNIKYILREIECGMAFADEQFVGDNEAQSQFLRNRYKEIKKILVQSGVDAPEKINFPWLYSIREALSLGQPGYANRKDHLKTLYHEAQRIAQSK